MKFEIDFPSALELEVFVAALNYAVVQHDRYLQVATTPEFTERIRRCHHFLNSVAWEADALLKETAR